MISAETTLMSAFVVVGCLAYFGIVLLVSALLSVNRYDSDEPVCSLERRAAAWAVPRVDQVLDHLAAHPNHSRAWARHDLLTLGVSNERVTQLLAGAPRRASNPSWSLK